MACPIREHRQFHPFPPNRFLSYDVVNLEWNTTGPMPITTAAPRRTRGPHGNEGAARCSWYNTPSCDFCHAGPLAPERRLCTTASGSRRADDNKRDTLCERFKVAGDEAFIRRAHVKHATAAGTGWLQFRHCPDPPRRLHGVCPIDCTRSFEILRTRWIQSGSSPGYAIPAAKQPFWIVLHDDVPLASRVPDAEPIKVATTTFRRFGDSAKCPSGLAVEPMPPARQTNHRRRRYGMLRVPIENHIDGTAIELSAYPEDCRLGHPYDVATAPRESPSSFPFRCRYQPLSAHLRRCQATPICQTETRETQPDTLRSPPPQLRSLSSCGFHALARPLCADRPEHPKQQHHRYKHDECQGHAKPNIVSKAVSARPHDQQVGGMSDRRGEGG